MGGRAWTQGVNLGNTGMKHPSCVSPGCVPALSLFPCSETRNAAAADRSSLTYPLV